MGIIRQENMESDWVRLMARLNIADPPMPTRDNTLAHTNNYDATPPLSDLAIENLNRWYVQDVEFYKRCEDWIDQQDS
mgnify:FL=1